MPGKSFRFTFSDAGRGKSQASYAKPRTKNRIPDTQILRTQKGEGHKAFPFLQRESLRRSNELEAEPDSKLHLTGIIALRTS